MTLTFGSLFSGIGGFDLAFERAGMRCAWQCEIDPAARSVLAKHWPNVPCYEDVRDVKRDNVAPVDLICGGFPCQDLSVAGKRAGLAGERSGLWFEFHRILAELRPSWVVIENVPGLLSSHGGRDFAVLLRGLVELRYGVSYRVLDAQYFGVAQRRRRVFIVGHLGDGRSAEVLFERAGSVGHPAPRRETGQGLAGTLGGGSGESKRGWRNDLDTNGAYVPVAYNVQHNDGGQHKRQDRPNGGMYVNETDTALTVGTTDLTCVAYGGNRTSGPIDTATACNAHGGSGRLDFESETFVVGFGQESDGSSIRNASDLARPVTGRHGDPGMVAFQSSQSGVREVEQHATLDSHNGSRRQNGVAGAFGVRRLTPTECERLQGFPDGHTAGQSDSARYRQLGNAVAVPVVEWIARRIVQVEQEPTP